VDHGQLCQPDYARELNYSEQSESQLHLGTPKILR